MRWRGTPASAHSLHLHTLLIMASTWTPLGDVPVAHSGQPPVPEAEGPRRGLERGSGEEHEEEQGQGDASPSNESSDEDGGPSLTLQ